MALVHILRTHAEGRRNLCPCPTCLPRLAHLVLLADPRDIPQREHTEEPKLWVLIGGQADEAETSLRCDGNSSHPRELKSEPTTGLYFRLPICPFCTAHQLAVIAIRTAGRSPTPADQDTRRRRAGEVGSG